MFIAILLATDFNPRFSRPRNGVKTRDRAMICEFSIRMSQRLADALVEPHVRRFATPPRSALVLRAKTCQCLTFDTPQLIAAADHLTSAATEIASTHHNPSYIPLCDTASTSPRAAAAPSRTPSKRSSGSVKHSDTIRLSSP